MKKSVRTLLILSLAISLFQCTVMQPTQKVATYTTTPTATIDKEGFCNCFEKGFSYNDKPIWCEASAILNDGYSLFIANDKSLPYNRSSVFSWGSFEELEFPMSPRFRFEEPLRNAIKYEDFALSSDNQWIFLTTGFDRVKETNDEWDNYNTILYWARGKERFPKVLSIEDDAASSVKLREVISKGLEGSLYFKVEGLAAADNKLYFGIREEGSAFNDFKYKVKILVVPYKVVSTDTDKKIILDGDATVFADINVDALEQGLQKPLGLSSIEFDPYRKIFWILTSYESGEQLGAYLWTATEADLKANKMSIVKGKSGNPLVFSHKAEDLTFLTPTKMMIIHDDDRVVTEVNGVKRQPHQAAYSILQIK
jgi:hypothetical protein